MLLDAIYPKPIEIVSFFEIYAILFALCFLVKIRKKKTTSLPLKSKNLWQLYQVLESHDAPKIQTMPLHHWLTTLDTNMDSNSFSSNSAVWQKGLFSSEGISETEWQLCVQATKTWLIKNVNR